METTGRVFLLAGAVWLGLAGCGGSSGSNGSRGTTQPVPQACTGVSIKGMMVDSLTRQPVAQGWAVLESGAPFFGTIIYDFSQIQRVNAGTAGDFQLCATALSNPSAVILIALDSGGKSYPPFVSAVSAAVDLGTIPMGGCAVVCGFEGSQQTTEPVIITGSVSTSPISKTVSMVASYDMAAPDGSKSAQGYPYLWKLAMPTFDAEQVSNYTTTAGACALAAPFCATYKFTLPSQSATYPFTAGGIPGYLRPAAAPIYMIEATVQGTPSCSLPVSLTIYQQDGVSLLIGNPGAQLTAMTASFTQCQ